MKIRFRTGSRLILALIVASFATAASTFAADEKRRRDPRTAAETTGIQEDAPAEKEIFGALPKKVQAEVLLAQKNGEVVHIACEQLLHETDPPRFFPLVGAAQLHHCHWKCTINYTTTIAATAFHHNQVVYIDKDHLHLVTSPVDKSAESVASSKESDLNLIPETATAFITIRVADLMEKLKLKGLAATLPQCKQELGVPLNDVKRITWAASGSPVNGTVLLVRLTRPCKRDDVLKALALDGNTVEHHEKKCYIGGKDNTALFFDDAPLLVLGSSEEVLAHFLKESPGPSLMDAFELTDNHDVTAWGRLDALPKDEMPFPIDIESALVTLDFGEQIALDIHVSCNDDAGVRWTKKALKSCVDMARVQLLAIPTVLDMAQLAPSVMAAGDMKELQFLPMKLMRKTEKALQHARVTTEGANVSLSVQIPMDAKALRSELSRIVRMIAMDSVPNANGFCTPLFGQTWMQGTSKNSVEPLPAHHVPLPGPTDPLMADLLPAPAIPYPLPAVAPGISTGLPPALNSGPDSPLPFPMSGGIIPTSIAGPKPLSPISAPSPGPSPVPPSVPSSPAVATPPSKSAAVQNAPSSITITVVNVRKSTAQLFECVEAGKSTFVQKIPAGQAVDMKLTSGRKYIAVSVDKPDSEPVVDAFTAAKSDSIWLLR